MKEGPPSLPEWSRDEKGEKGDAKCAWSEAETDRQPEGPRRLEVVRLVGFAEALLLGEVHAFDRRLGERVEGLAEPAGAVGTGIPAGGVVEIAIQRQWLSEIVSMLEVTMISSTTSASCILTSELSVYAAEIAAVWILVAKPSSS